MTGYTAKNSAVKDVDLGDGFVVTVRTRLTHGETKRAKQALMDATMKVVDETPETSAKIDMVNYEQEIAMAAIIAWNLTDEAGNVLPLEPEEAKRASIDLMDSDDFDKVVAAIEGVAKKKSDKRAKA